MKGNLYGWIIIGLAIFYFVFFIIKNYKDNGKLEKELKEKRENTIKKISLKNNEIIIVNGEKYLVGEALFGLDLYLHHIK